MMDDADWKTKQQKRQLNSILSMHAYLTWKGYNRQQVYKICFHCEKKSYVARRSATQRSKKVKALFCQASKKQNLSRAFFLVRKWKYANETRNRKTFAFCYFSSTRKRFKNNFIKNMHVCQYLPTSSPQKNTKQILLIAWFTQLYSLCLFSKNWLQNRQMREEFWEWDFFSSSA